MNPPPAMSAPATPPAQLAPTNPSCPATGNPVVQHTRATDYTNHGCRCHPARRDRERRRKQQHLLPSNHVPIVGARRRLQSLMAIGWSQNDLNEQLGRARSGSLGPLIWDQHRTTLSRDLHDRIVTVYDRLWDKPGPSERTRRAAATHRWPPPLWWDDDVIDDPLFNETNDLHIDEVPNRISSRRQRRLERLEHVARLTRQGYSARQISEHLGISARQVVRDRADLGLSMPPELSCHRGTVDRMQVAS